MDKEAFKSYSEEQHPFVEEATAVIQETMDNLDKANTTEEDSAHISISSEDISIPEMEELELDIDIEDFTDCI
jgi:hypothetical protein